MKKVLISVLVAMCVLGTVSTAFAASYPDTTGTKYEAAVGVLSSLGLLKGYPDGTFKPASTITRAEFATIAVRALGLESAAAQAVGATPFSDVPASHWASGYVNIAASQKIINGYPDGTFKPAQPVSYAEALAMIVRMLGYDPAVTGSWPTGYLVKAYDLGIPKGIAVSANSPAVRGDVAFFFDNALTVGLMEQQFAGSITSYVVTDKTLLEDKLGYKAVKGFVSDVPSLFGTDLDDGEVVIGGDQYDVAEGLDFGALVGVEVKAWYNSDNQIIVAERVTKDENVVTGTVTANDANLDTVTIGKKTYDAAEDMILIVNNTAADRADFDVDGLVDYEVQAVRDSHGDIASLVAKKFDGSLFVTGVNAKYNRFEGVRGDASKVSTDLDDYAGQVVILKGGAAIDATGLAAGDVARYFESESGDDFYMEVTSDKVSGKLESIDSDQSGTVLTIGGKRYTMADNATLSGDNNKTFAAFADDEAALADYADKQVTAYLDAAGLVRQLTGSFGVSAAETKGIVKSEFFVTDNPDPEEADHYYVRLFKLDGSSVKLEVGKKTQYGAIEGGEFVADDSLATTDIANGEDALDLAFPAGTMVSYTMNGNVVSTMGVVAPDEDTAFDDGCVDTDHNTFTTDSGTYRVGPNALFIDTTNWKIRKWADFKDISVENGPVTPVSLFTNAAGNAVTYVLYPATSDPTDASADFGISYGTKAKNFGIVLGRQTTADGVKVRILLADGKTVSYLYDADTTELATFDGHNYDLGGSDGAALSELAKGDYVEYAVDGDTLESITEVQISGDFFAADTCLGDGYVADFSEDDGTIRITGDPENYDPADAATYADYLLALDCVVFDVSGSTPATASLDDVARDQLVRLFYDADGYVAAIVIAD